MWTFLRVKAALLPLPIYALGVWLGYPFLGTVLGLAYGLSWSLWQHHARIPPAFETGFLAGLALVVAGFIADIPAISANATPIVLLSLALGAAVSVLTGRPWTSTFAASSYAGAAQSQLFKTINTQLSALWAVVFLWQSLAAYLHLPGTYQWSPVVGGGLVSILLPGFLVKRGLTRMAAGDQRNAWTAPDFSQCVPAPSSFDDSTDVAVIGAGIGGLTAAALLAASGLKVDVFDHHVVAGGFAHTWLRRARDPDTGQRLVFRFDSGVHDVSGWHSGGTVRSLFERLGIADYSKWARLDHRYVIDGQQLDVPRDWRAYAAELGRLCPSDAAGILKLFEDIHAVYTGMFSTAKNRSGIPGMPPTPEALMAFASNHPMAVAWMDKPWAEFVARHVSGKEALHWISALSGYITDDAGKIKVSDMVPLFGYYFEGGYYPIGGSGCIADALVHVIEQNGGRVHLKTSVEKVLCEGGAVRGVVVRALPSPARRIAAKAVVSNADLGKLMNQLIDDPAVCTQFKAQAGRIVPACSAFGVHLGIRGKLDLPPVVHVSGAAGGVGLVCPTAVDPSAAPDGYSTLELLKLIPNAEAKAWFSDASGEADFERAALRRSEAYQARKRRLGDDLISRARVIVPDLEQRIVYRAESSPVTYGRYSWTSDGSIYGTRAGNPMSVKTPLAGLVLAGATTHGAGVEAVVISGALAAEALKPGLLTMISSNAEKSDDSFRGFTGMSVAR